MTVAKAVVRGVLIASLAASSAHGGSMLVLGVTSGGWDSSRVASSQWPSSPPSISTGPGPALHLGVYSDSGPSIFASRLAPPPIASPAPTPAPSPSPSPSPIATSFSAQSLMGIAPSAPAPTPSTYDAFINLGSGPYPNSESLTTGNPQPWYLGSQVGRIFGGVPSLQQRAAFDDAVLQRVQQTFQLGGVPVSLTDDPNAQAAHTVSVVSQASNPTLNGALGMTYVGGNGFNYIDTAANSARSVDQLEWIVAHNLAHELMLAFNVPEVHDQSGQFIDARNVSLSMISNPAATFSPGAVSDLLSRDFQATNGSVLYPSAQVLDASAVPEPSTVLLWVALGSAGLLARRGRRRPVDVDRTLNLP